MKIIQKWYFSLCHMAQEEYDSIFSPFTQSYKFSLWPNYRAADTKALCSGKWGRKWNFLLHGDVYHEEVI